MVVEWTSSGLCKHDLFNLKFWPRIRRSFRQYVFFFPMSPLDFTTISERVPDYRTRQDSPRLTFQMDRSPDQLQLSSLVTAGCLKAPSQPLVGEL